MLYRTVVETTEFSRSANALLSEDERLAIISAIAENPLCGESLGGGLRKVRFGGKGRGKRGGYRVVFFFVNDDGVPVLLVDIYSKSGKSGLSPGETEYAKKTGKDFAKAKRVKQGVGHG